MPARKSKKKKLGRAYSRREALARNRAILLSKEADERRRILINHCLKMEAWGPRAGKALMRFEGLLYDSQIRQYHRIPGRKLTLLVDSEVTIDQAWLVLEQAFQTWLRGRWATGPSRFQCECGKLL